MSEYTEVGFYAKGTDCSVDYRLAHSVFMGDLQEAADSGARDCGFDRFVIDKHNLCWIILRMKVHIIDMPRWRDSFKVRTWSTGLDKLFFDREYEVFDSDNNVIAQGSSLWIMADMDTHRPANPLKSLGMDSFPPQNTRLVFGEKCGRIKALARHELEGDPVITKFADYSELDWNNHVNNTRYIAWICDAMAKKGYNPGDISDIEINYISEVKQGEKVDLYVIPAGKSVLVYGYRDGDNAIFASEIAICN